MQISHKLLLTITLSALCAPSYAPGLLANAPTTVIAEANRVSAPREPEGTPFTCVTYCHTPQAPHDVVDNPCRGMIYNRGYASRNHYYCETCGTYKIDGGACGYTIEASEYQNMRRDLAVAEFDITNNCDGYSEAAKAVARAAEFTRFFNALCAH